MTRDDWSREELFDDDYLYFYASRHADELSDAEAARVWELLELRAGDEVLDLACGHGRIANRLAARGAAVTGLDATPQFLELARSDAAERGVDVEYVQGDMRELPWNGRFDAVVSWFTAFGYFDDAGNKAVLDQVVSALRPGGRFVVELNHKDGLLPLYRPAFVDDRGNGDMLIDRMEYDPLTSRSNTWRTVVRGGRARTTFYFVRMFSFTELRDWLLEAGFGAVEGFAGDGGELTALARRMILVATKSA